MEFMITTVPLDEGREQTNGTSLLYQIAYTYGTNEHMVFVISFIATLY